MKGANAFSLKICAVSIFLLAILFSPNVFARSKPKLNHSINTSALLTDDCLHFVDNKALDLQKNRWLAILKKNEKQEVLKWISGQAKPPKTVLKLVRKQYRCMLKHMTSEATQKDSTLNLQNRKKRMSAKQLKLVAAQAQTRSGIARLDKKILRSFYRKSTIQAGIWKRKFLFSGKSFNIVSKESATRCNLKVGTTWKPRVKKHRWCWKKMSGEEREKEILLASSAPGISRHHWGTDIDIFGLNPRTFVEGKKNFDEYVWLTEKASEFGFFQPYSDQRPPEKIGYMNERWHWSYYPLSNALTEYAKENSEALELVLFEQWDAMEKKRRKKVSYFSYIRSHWRSFVFNVAELPTAIVPNSLQPNKKPIIKTSDKNLSQDIE